MFGSTCATSGCGKGTAILSDHCRYHNVIDQARWLTPDDFDRLRETLSTTAPVTRDERNAARARSELRAIEWRARDLKRSKKDARKAGATATQIADAVKRGKDQVR